MRVVIGMFNELKNTISADLREIKETIATLSNHTGDGTQKDKLRDLETAVENYNKDNNHNKRRWQIQATHEDIMVKCLSDLTIKLEETKHRVEKLEEAGNKRSMIISGFYTEKNKKAARAVLDVFFRDEMGISPRIDDIYFLGDNDPDVTKLRFCV